MGGCAGYKAFPLEPLRPEFHSSAMRVEGVGAACEVLSDSTSKRYFFRNVRQQGYQPVQFTVTNGPKRHLELRLSQINLPAAQPESVAEKCHFSTAGRATTYGVVGIFIWPFLIPAIVDGVGSAKANGQMDLDFSAKSLKDQVVSPHSVANGVLFVPTNQVSSEITMRLIDSDAKQSMLFRWVDGKPVEGRMEGNEQTTP